MSQFVSEFRVGPTWPHPPAEVPCRKLSAAAAWQPPPPIIIAHSRFPRPHPNHTCRAGACSAAAAVSGGSNAAARCKPPACSASSALACATRVPHAVSLPMWLPLPLAPRHLYRPCTAAQFTRSNVRNSPPLKPLLVFFFHAAC
jgi:hypothetical protein